MSQDARVSNLECPFNILRSGKKPIQGSLPVFGPATGCPKHSCFSRLLVDLAFQKWAKTTFHVGSGEAIPYSPHQYLKTHGT